MLPKFTMVIEREFDTYVAPCSEFDIAGQGEPGSQARNRGEIRTDIIWGTLGIR